MPPHRVEFTKDHDSYLVKYLARHNPTKQGRSGNKLFERLVAEENKARWPWAANHSWQSWRDRYVKNAERFDKLVLNYQRKHATKAGSKTDKRKRAAEPRPIEMLEPSAKRVKLAQKEEEEEEEEESSSSESTQREKANGSTSRSKAKHPREPPETPQKQNPTQPTSIRRSTYVSSPSRSPAIGSTSSTKKPVSVSEATAQGGGEVDSLEILPPSPDRPNPFSTSPRSPPRHVKRIKARLSDEFASEPPSPQMDGAAQDPSSQAQPVPSTSGTGRDMPPATTVYPRAPPRVVDSLYGQVLVNTQGRVPCLFPPGEKDEAEDEAEKDQWPPARGHTNKQRRTSGSDVEVKTHHPFSQPLSQPKLPRDSDRAQIRRAVAAQFTGRVHPAPGPSAESERRESGSSPVKRVTAAPPSDPFAGQIPKAFSKVFPAPRASTRSPFRPEPPAAKTRRSPAPKLRPLSPTRVARHPALTRIRRQTIANGDQERRRNVPSLDLVALSHSSMSRSDSHSSTTSVPARPPRWSLPAFTHAAPWALDEPQLGYGDPWHGQAKRSSVVGMSTPQFMLTPSPTRSITGPTASTSHVHPAHPARAPHPPDLQLTASHGLASILAHMAANHELGLGVVEAVYARAGSLREADEVLKGMREAAEIFGERELKRRHERRGRSGMQRGEAKQEQYGNGKTVLRYVIASEDGEGSEYSPPETSRAALWKRQSESASYGEEEAMEEEEEEGREVEEELRDYDQSEDEEETHHPFSRLEFLNDEVRGQDRAEDAWDGRVTGALLEDAEHAHHLEKKLGKARYRKEVIAKHFE